jgi:uncharacterized protein YjbI with pentapeptide repeats
MDLWIGIVGGVASGLIVGIALFVGQLVVDDQRADRERSRDDAQIERQNSIEDARDVQGTRLENLRFVRGLSSRDDLALERPFRGLDLGGMELAGLSLVGADFENSNLAHVSFRSADLRGAQFGGANVDGADFTNANLAGASFSYENRETAASGPGPDSLAQADLSGTLFRRITTWHDLNLSGSNLTGARFEEVDLSDAFVSGAVFDNVCPLFVEWPDLALAGVVVTIAADCPADY